MDNVCNECNFLVCQCISNVISPIISTESSPENTEYVHVNSNDETHLINSQLSTHFSNNLTDGVSEGQSSSGDSIDGISDETVANLRLRKKGMNMVFFEYSRFVVKIFRNSNSFNIRRKQKLAYFQYV